MHFRKGNHYSASKNRVLATIDLHMEIFGFFGVLQ